MTGRSGSLWIENGQLCYIDADGTKRCGDVAQSPEVDEAGVGNVDLWVFVDTTGSSTVINDQQETATDLVDHLDSTYPDSIIRCGCGAIGPEVPVQITQELTSDLTSAKNEIRTMPTGGGTEEYNEAAATGAQRSDNSLNADVIVTVFADTETGDTTRTVSEIIDDLLNARAKHAAILGGQDRDLNGELTDLGDEYEHGKIVDYNESVNYVTDILENDFY